MANNDHITDEEVENILDSLISGEDIPGAEEDPEEINDEEPTDAEESNDDSDEYEPEELEGTEESEEETDHNASDDNSDSDSDNDSNSKNNIGSDNDSDNDQESNNGTNADEENEDAEDISSNEQQTAQDDYKKKYEELQQEYEKINNFYKRVTSPFKANGQEIRIDDPEKIIRGLQMSVGYTDKMRKFKEYRPFLNPLRERGILENPEKFNMLIDAMDGNKDAIKKLIADANINPLELGSTDEETNYMPTDHTANDFDLAFEDLIDNSRQAGVEQPLVENVLKNWDDASVAELVMDKQSANDIVSHIENGAFDLVTKRIKEKEIFDPAYADLPDIEKYRSAAQEVEQEFIEFLEREAANGNPEAQYGYELATGKKVQPVNSQPQFDEAAIQAEMQKIVNERKYAAKIEQEKQAKAQRKNAASFNTKGSKTKKQRNEPVDPMDLSDSEIEDILNSLIAG